MITTDTSFPTCMKKKNKKLKNMLKRRNITEGPSLEMGKMKEELNVIRSKVGVYDKVVIVLSLLVLVLGFVVATRI